MSVIARPWEPEGTIVYRSRLSERVWIPDVGADLISFLHAGSLRDVKAYVKYELNLQTGSYRWVQQDEETLVLETR